MPVPDNEILDFSKSFDGQPFVQISTAGDTLDFSFSFDGAPFTATESGAVTLSETILIADVLTADVDAYPADTADELIISYSYEIVFDETGLITDTVSSTTLESGPFDLTFSTVISISTYNDITVPSNIQIAEYVDFTATTNVNVMENYLLSTSNVTAPGNIFEPTVIVNGAYVVQNPSTDPGGDISQTSVYINIKNAGLTGISACDLEGYNFTLDYNGGNFSIISTETMGALGDVIDLYGFKGTITVNGQALSNGQAGFTQRGIFGNPKLNRMFQYLAGSNSTLSPLLTNSAFYNAGSESWQTASSVARAIAGIAGINLQWLPFDVAVSDFRIEDSMTAIDALSSMAAKVGAQLRWNGNNSYIIAYPDQYFGLWSPPSCSLIASDGLSNENYLDLSTGLYGSNMGIISSFAPVFNSGEKTLPVPPGGGAPQVQQILKMRTKMTSNDPPLIHDLPLDYDKVYIQILVPDNGDTSGTNQIGIANFITKSPAAWFEFTASAFGNNPYVFTTNVGGAYVPQVKIDYKVFPTVNSSINKGNFWLSVACTRKQPPATQPVNNIQQQAAQVASQESFRFIKTYSGTFSCVFFGSIPVPGMWASATVPNVRLSVPNNFGGYDIKVIGDVTVEGIIESVNFSFPGFVTVQVAQYKRLNFIEVPRINYGP